MCRLFLLFRGWNLNVEEISCESIQKKKKKNASEHTCPINQHFIVLAF